MHASHPFRACPSPGFRSSQGDLNWKFISGVREPISFLLSGYYEMYFMDKGEPSIEDVREALPRLLPWHSGYMDRELCANVGLDPYAVPFDRDKGYTILREGAVSLLVFRQDRLSAVFPDAVHDFSDSGMSALSMQTSGGRKRTWW